MHIACALCFCSAQRQAPHLDDVSLLELPCLLCTFRLQLPSFCGPQPLVHLLCIAHCVICDLLRALGLPLDLLVLNALDGDALTTCERLLWCIAVNWRGLSCRSYVEWRLGAPTDRTAPGCDWACWRRGVAGRLAIDADTHAHGAEPAWQLSACNTAAWQAADSLVYQVSVDVLFLLACCSFTEACMSASLFFFGSASSASCQRRQRHGMNIACYQTVCLNRKSGAQLRAVSAQRCSSACQIGLYVEIAERYETETRCRL
jgi:hypothetical protein